jgi:hypothetical protein
VTGAEAVVEDEAALVVADGGDVGVADVAEPPARGQAEVTEGGGHRAAELVGDPVEQGDVGIRDVQRAVAVPRSSSSESPRSTSTWGTGQLRSQRTSRAAKPRTNRSPAAPAHTIGGGAVARRARLGEPVQPADEVRHAVARGDALRLAFLDRGRHALVG